ncbi:preprotein translocase subunit SecE [Listeria ivanovii FSL F6-596]|nr:preprotein translocase subunit SecE [Listeria ivanovii FSL F6-596]
MLFELPSLLAGGVIWLSSVFVDDVIAPFTWLLDSDSFFFELGI